MEPTVSELMQHSLALTRNSFFLQLIATVAIVIFGGYQMWRSARADGRGLRFEKQQEARHNAFMEWWKEQHEEHKQRHQETMRGFEQQEQESVRRHEEVMAEIHHSSSDSGDESARTRDKAKETLEQFTVPSTRSDQ